MNWYLTVVLIFISLLANDVEYFLMSLLDICISLKKCPFKSITHVLMGYKYFRKSFWYTLDTSSLLDTWFTKNYLKYKVLHFEAVQLFCLFIF